MKMIKKLYTDFEFCEEENHRHLRNIMMYKARQIMMTVLHILEDGTSDVQVGDIKRVIV